MDHEEGLKQLEGLKLEGHPLEQLHAGPSAVGADVKLEILEVERDDRAELQKAKIQELKSKLESPEGMKAAAQLVQGGELRRPEEMLEEMFLRRWLRARRWDVEVTTTSILSHAEWRVTTMPNGSIPASEVQAEVACGKVSLLGWDLQGRPVLLIQARKHSVWSRKIEETKAFCCYILDIAVAVCNPSLNPKGHIAVILDLTDMGMTNMDIPAVTALFKLLGAHYVERLGTMVMYNPPLIFWGAWNALSPLLPPVTRQKIIVVSATERKLMIENLGADVLPKEYGGFAPPPEPIS